MLQLDDYDDLVHQIYDASLNPDGWPAVMARVVRACRATRGGLFTPQHTPAQGGLMIPVDLPESMMALWAARFSGVENDPFTRAAVARGLFREGAALDGDDLVPTPALLPTPFYRELWSPVDIGRMCGGVVFDSTDAHKLPTALVLFRRLQDAPFGSAELELVRRLVAHLSRALGVMFHLRGAQWREASLRATLDRLGCGVVLVSASDGVSFMNASAARQVAGEVAADALWRMETAAGRPPMLRLAPRLARFEAGFRRAIASALDPLNADEEGHFSQALLLPDAKGRPRCVVHAAPLRASSLAGMLPTREGSTAAQAILFLYDLTAALAVPPSLLVKLFGLTEAEARVALQVLQGGSAGEMAATLGVATSTVRAQLQAVYGKTGTHRRADLLKMLLSLAAR
ncbi:helix-turn-helix transcriptional regulator [uncultured Variovorax sp.]|uniref:helix-turn-helix transcriptional regulator n=1 Tax=uncultured Variovorax sp. TaxID=114708 RepID=UPI0025FB12EB|nr:helix-turn-helix transcriptional regulator [uncultured Variovorax sp.]